MQDKLTADTKLPEPHYNHADNQIELSVEQWGDVLIAFDSQARRIAELEQQLRESNERGIAATARVIELERASSETKEFHSFDKIRSLARQHTNALHQDAIEVKGKALEEYSQSVEYHEHLGDVIETALRTARLQNWKIEGDEGSHLPLLDHLSIGDDCSTGNDEIELLAEHILLAIEEDRASESQSIENE